MNKFKNILFTNKNMKFFHQLVNLPEELNKYIKKYIHPNTWSNFVFDIRQNLILLYPEMYVTNEQFTLTNNEIEFIAIEYHDNSRYKLNNKIETIIVAKKLSIVSQYKTFQESFIVHRSRKS